MLNTRVKYHIKIVQKKKNLQRMTILVDKLFDSRKGCDNLYRRNKDYPVDSSCKRMRGSLVDLNQ